VNEKVYVVVALATELPIVTDRLVSGAAVATGAKAPTARASTVRPSPSLVSILFMFVVVLLARCAMLLYVSD
jgi:hypothetical protein